MAIAKQQAAARIRLAAISSHLRPSPTTPRSPTTQDQHSSSISARRPSSSEAPAPSSALKNNNQSSPITASQWTQPHIYRYWVPVQTRWSDNDVYGHMNNAKYYELFDTIVNKYLREECAEDEPSMGLVVHSGCDYLKPVGFPTRVILGLAVERIGRSSVVWRIGLWSSSTRASNSTPESDQPAISVDNARDDQIGCHALGKFVHVFVDHSSRTKIDISPVVRAGASRLLVEK
ncbi:hypothetical protein PGTUg99_009821 [Puccinia graminis f. sp. tritici]|uniref:Thioesterase domain-containing protein n=1 Tax=Puccinia graminis f. sp. tritici TaxID=56615 RepID=A0A5B0RSB4_PUCGR|nr:hypothetical protein PGTUg99_009821 [Puccinia graminis f. sp. tritici]